MQVLERIDGVVIGLLVGFEDGAPLVAFGNNERDEPIKARSLAVLDHARVGDRVALLFEGGDPALPLVVGAVVSTGGCRNDLQVVRDGETVKINAEDRLELRCGLASIIMEKDGRISIRGGQLTSYATGVNRVRGAAVHLN